jgi:hypothetical protein
MRFLTTLLLLLAGCPGKDAPCDSDCPDTDDTDPKAKGDFSVVAEAFGDATLLSIWSNGDEALFVGGDLRTDGTGTLARYDGDTLCYETAVTDKALWWIHGPREGEWYAVGAGGVILHETDGTRVREDVAVDDGVVLYGVWADPDQDLVYAVGGNPIVPTDEANGQVWKRVGGTWSLVADQLPGTLFKVWNGWIIGDEVGYRIDTDGTLTEDRPLDGDGQPVRLTTIVGRDASDVWAVGGFGKGQVFHHDGSAWSEADATGLQGLMGVWTSTNDHVWVSGSGGMTAYWDGSDWNFPTFPVAFDSFHAVLKHGDEFLFAGGNFQTSAANTGSVVRFGTGTSALTPTECAR